MKKTTRTFPLFSLRLVAAAALASAATWAGAGEITIAALTPSNQGTGDPVQDLGKIQAVAGYDAEVSRVLLRHARHPDKAQASPRRLNGRVDVDFEINRDGSLKQAAIAQSSRSNALDGAALAAVQRATFRPFAEQESLTRRYVVTFDYRYVD